MAKKKQAAGKKASTKAKKPPVKAKKAPVKAKKETAKAKKIPAPAKKVTKEPKKAPVKAKKTLVKTKKTYSVAEFSEMTYLTQKGVNEWLKQGKLKGEKDENGNWMVDAASLQLSFMNKLIR